jgi:hypothetical protein
MTYHPSLQPFDAPANVLGEYDYRRDDNRGPGDGTPDRGIENVHHALRRLDTPPHYPGMHGLTPMSPRDAF